MIYDIALSVVS